MFFRHHILASPKTIRLSDLRVSKNTTASIGKCDRLSARRRLEKALSLEAVFVGRRSAEQPGPARHLVRLIVGEAGDRRAADLEVRDVTGCGEEIEG